MIYLVDIFYSAGSPFRAFFNNHLFADVPAYERSAVRLPCHPFFVKGNNTITIAWGEIPVDNTGKDIEEFLENGPEFIVQLRAKTDWGDDGRILWTREMSSKDITKYKGKKIPAYMVTFENPTTIAFDSLLTESVICNETKEEFTKYFIKMREFSSYIYRCLLEGAHNEVLKRSKTAIKDGALAFGKSEADFLSGYRTALEEIRADGLGYKLNSLDQFVFLPTCGGRLWLVGFMHEEKSAQEAIAETCMRPHAIIRYDKDLIHGEHSGGLSQKIPIFIGFPNGECEIVRVS